MATVIFMPFHWDANINSTFAVARGLRKRRLNRLIDEALENPSYSAKIKAMSQTFVELQRRQPAVDAIENTLKKAHIAH